MIKVLMERDLPASFDLMDEGHAAWHARVALDAAAGFHGRMSWLCTYATEDRKLFGLVVVEDESVIEEWAKRAGITASIKFHKVLRVLDPSTAGPPGMANPLEEKRS